MGALIRLLIPYLGEIISAIFKGKSAQAAPAPKAKEPVKVTAGDIIAAKEIKIVEVITLEDLLTSSGKYPQRSSHPECTETVKKNAVILLKKVNAFLSELGISQAKVASGFRTQEANKAAKGAPNSSHLKGLACDILDVDGKLDKLFSDNDKLLKKYGLWLENPSNTTGWSHLDIKDRGKRPKNIFIPSGFMNLSGIYCIKNKINNKSYIGSAINFGRRFRQHRHLLRNNKHHSQYLQRSWTKYGETNFVFQILEIVEDKASLISREAYFFSILSPEFNVSKIYPTRLGSKCSAEQKKRMSDAHKGKPNPRKGVKTGKPAWNSGKTNVYSKETLLKMSKSNSGRKNTSSTKIKPGQILAPHLCKKVMCIEKGILYNSVADAARATGSVKNSANISAVCSGRQKTAYGYTWRYQN